MRLLPTVTCCLISTLLVSSFSPPASACENGVEMVKSEAVKLIAQVEFHLRYEHYWLAGQAIPVGEYGNVGLIEVTDGNADDNHPDWERSRFDARLIDADRLLDLRWREDNTEWAVHWFERRYEIHKTPKYAAWLAEAHAANGELARALDLLRPLEKKDLMPDAHAYAVLARLTIGAEHRNATAKCHVRALVKAICPPLPIKI